MNRLLGWHTRAGELGLRLLQLHLLWIVGTLRGGVLLGVFPATAAVVAVIRRDVLDDDLAPDGDHRQREPLRREFSTFWRQELVPANTLGYAITVLWAVLLLGALAVGNIALYIGAFIRRNVSDQFTA